MTMENDLVERLTRERDEALALVNYAEDISKTQDARIQALEAELAHYKSMHGVNIRTGRKLVMRERARAERAEAKLARKTEALKPFAEAADSLDANDDYSSASIWEHPCALDITVGDLRRARRAARSALEEKTDV